MENAKSLFQKKESKQNYDEKVEEKIIGHIFSKSYVDIILKEVKKEYFYFYKNEIIFRACVEIYKENGMVDLTSVSTILKKENNLEKIGNIGYLTKCISESLGESNFEYQIKTIKEFYKLRVFNDSLIQTVYKIENGKYNNVNSLISDFNKTLFDVNSQAIEEKVDIKSIIESFSKRQDEYTNKVLDGKKYLGIPTGYPSLDRMCEGYNPEHLMSFAAYTNVGKTTLMVNLIKKLMDQDVSVCVFSLEMSQEDLFGKLLSIETGIPKKDLMKKLSDNVIFAEQEEAKQRLSKKKLFIYSQISTIEDIVMAMQTERIKNGVEVFFFDYIQNVSSESNINEYTLLTYAIKLLQQTNRRLKSTLVLLSQVSNESNKATTELNIEGKGTGAIKAASDLFIFMKRDCDEAEITNCVNNNIDIPLKIIVNKNRHDYFGAFALKHKLNTGEMYEPL